MLLGRVIIRRNLVLTAFVLSVFAVGARAAEPIAVQSAFVRILDEAEVPARDAGVLSALEVHEGDAVKSGQVIGQLDDEEAQVTASRAELELAIAEKQVQNTLPLNTAEALLKEAQHDRTQVELTHRIASRKSDNDVAVRHAHKSRDAAKAELDRAAQARKDFAKSISQTEIDRLRLIVEKNELEIEKAEFDKELADLQKQIEDSSLAEQDQTVERLRLTVEQARVQKEVDGLTRDLKSRAVDQAKLHWQRRRLRSPLDGVVVQVFRHRGEWLEPGQRVLRIVRLDRLRVEGFVDSRQVRGNLRGAAVVVHVTLAEETRVTVKGKLVFVSPEVDPVNNQVRVWAEIDNPDLTLRPGLPAEMMIEPARAK